MTTLPEMYAGVLYEINKFESADFDYSDFNHFINQALELWLKEILEVYELTQVISDKIAPLIVSTTVVADPTFYSWNPTVGTDIREKTVPTDYRHVLSCLTKFRYKTATNSFAVNDRRSTVSKRVTGDSWSSILDNRYLRPLVSDSDMRLYHRVTGNKIGLHFDTPTYPNVTVNIENVIMEYVKQPVVMEIDEEFAVVTGKDTVFSPSVNRELVLICSKLFLENYQSPRLQTIAAN